MVEGRRDRKPLHCDAFIRPGALCCFQIDWRRRKTKALLGVWEKDLIIKGGNVKVVGLCKITVNVCSVITVQSFPVHVLAGVKKD